MEFVKNFWADIKKTPKKYSTLLGGTILMISLGSIGLIGSNF